MKSGARATFSAALRMAVPALLLCLPAIAFCANPTAVSVTPSSGSGTVQSFALAYSDSAGVSDLSWVFALFTPNGDGAHACGVYYHPGDDLIYLADDNNSTTLGPETVGSPGTLSNTQCTVDAGMSSTSVSGNTLTLNLVVTFHASGTFNGSISTYLYAEDNESNNSSLVKLGSWTIDANAVPAGVSVSPPAGSGPSHTFVLTYSDGNGSADLQSVYAYFSSSSASANTCYVWYEPRSNLIYLADDHGGFFGPGAVGHAGTLINNECFLNVGASSVSRTLNTLTLNIALTFEGQVADQENIYLSALDNEGNTGTPQGLGTFTVNFPSLYAVSATPASPYNYHTNRMTFTVTFSDANGGHGIEWAYILFTPNNDGAHACPVYVHIASGLIYLGNDKNNGTFGPGLMGSPGTLSNSQCELDVGGASTTWGPTTRQIELPVTFASALYGRLNIIAEATDNAGLSTGFQYVSTYTVSPPVAPSYFEATQCCITNLQAGYRDANGFQDLETLYIVIAPTLTTASSCYARYEMPSNTIYLSDDAGGWKGPGQAEGTGTLSNNECTIDLRHSGAFGALPEDPTDLYVDWAITHNAAPVGTVLWIYLNAVDNEGNSAGWKRIDSWTVHQ